MARLAVLLLSWLALAAGLAQQDESFRKAGVCARCHVISVVEWSMSRHSRAGTDCVSCHGKSQGHVADERNNIKPEQVPHAGAIAALCGECHQGGCPQSKQKANCETCHQAHALVDPNKPPAVRDEALEKRLAQWENYARMMQAGDEALRAQNWEQARAAFEAALREMPGDRRAAEKLRACRRRLQGVPAGFEIVGSRFDDRTGLPAEVRVSGTGISMLLVAGGDFQMGSERFANARPVHTVTIEPFYLARREMSQAEWKALMGSNPSTHKDDQLPVESVSWDDAQALVRLLNGKVPGGGFRLPTEAEWEFAARGAAVPEETLAEIAWFDGGGAQGAPQPSGTKKPDRLGFFDLRGNLWEWTSSLAKAYPYDASDGREDLLAKGLRILRGGCYADTSDLLDPAMRHSERPDRRLHWNGIRLARGVPAEP